MANRALAIVSICIPLQEARKSEENPTPLFKDTSWKLQTQLKTTNLYYIPLARIRSFGYL